MKDLIRNGNALGFIGAFGSSQAGATHLAGGLLNGLHPGNHSQSTRLFCAAQPLRGPSDSSLNNISMGLPQGAVELETDADENFLLPELAGVSNWRPAKQSNGIALFSGSKEGSAFHALKGSFSITADFDKAVSVLTDPNKVALWLDGMSSIELDESLHERDYFLRIQTAGVVGIPPRALVIRCETDIAVNSQAAVMSMRLASDRHDESDGRMYVKVFDGFVWLRSDVEAQGGQGDRQGSRTFEVGFEVHLDPGGSLPAFLVNPATRHSVAATLKNARDLLMAEASTANDAEAA